MAGVHEGPGLSVRYVVPWRPDGEYRDRLWAFCKPQWPGVIEGVSPTGAFNRSAAINAAAAGSWDMLVVVDADVIVAFSQVAAAIALAQRTGNVTLPFHHYMGLTAEMTERVLAGYDGEWGRGVRFQSMVHESSVVVIPRKVWETVGGFDERFVGWGQEDVAFIQSARVLTGEIQRVSGIVWHLWHPPPEQKRDKTSRAYLANQELGQRYRDTRTPEGMQDLLRERGRMPITERQRAFEDIYRSNGWNGIDSKAGPGSTVGATARLREELPALVAKLGGRRVLDAACGDAGWQPDLPGYVGVDIVPEAIETAMQKHPDRDYWVTDICTEVLPRADLILCRDAFQHMSFTDGLAALENFRLSGARWLIASTHRNGTNVDIRTGGYYPANLQVPPFSLGEPFWSIPDGMWDDGVKFPHKMLAAWELTPREPNRVVILVPWRGGDELREQSWEVVRPWLESLGYPVFLGDSVGPWSRGQAINNAARAAGNWDIAIIADADAIGEPETISRAISLAAASGGGIRPHDQLWCLTPSGALAIARGSDKLEPRHMTDTQPGGGFLVVSREGWDRVGGYNEAYVGWGHEDTALNMALLLKADWDRIEGNAWHLWHPASDRQTPEYRRNRMLMLQTQRENAGALQEIDRARGWALSRVL